MKAIEEKAKRYDEAIKKAKSKIKDDKDHVLYEDDIIDIFPELKKSEDWIPKEIIKYLKEKGDFRSCWLSWLEKQGEQKPADKVEPKFDDVEEVNFFDDFRKTDSEVEPKFKKGDWVIIDGETLHITNVTEDEYSTEEGGYIPFRCEKDARLWTIQDAKDGDVLCCENGWTCIFKTLINDETFSSYCFMDNTKWFCETGSEAHTLKEEFVKAYNGKIHPATKEQRDQLEKAMADAGYTFDFDKKELKKIKQKPAWSEEDEDILKTCLYFFNGGKGGISDNRRDNILNWLKSIKDRVQPKQEWSSKEDAFVQVCINAINGISYFSSEYKETVIDWLKLLKHQSTWKPSDEQIEALRYVTNFDYGGHKATLVSLYEQLKKLKG